MDVLVFFFSFLVEGFLCFKMSFDLFFKVEKISFDLENSCLNFLITGRSQTLENPMDDLEISSTFTTAHVFVESGVRSCVVVRNINEL